MYSSADLCDFCGKISLQLVAILLNNVMLHKSATPLKLNNEQMPGTEN